MSSLGIRTHSDVCLVKGGGRKSGSAPLSELREGPLMF